MAEIRQKPETCDDCGARTDALVCVYSESGPDAGTTRWLCGAHFGSASARLDLLTDAEWNALHAIGAPAVAEPLLCAAAPGGVVCNKRRSTFCAEHGAPAALLALVREWAEAGGDPALRATSERMRSPPGRVNAVLRLQRAEEALRRASVPPSGGGGAGPPNTP